MTAYLKILRPVNLLIIALTQGIILWKYTEEGLEGSLYDSLYIILSSVFAAAAGYVVNDLFDIKADSINKPEKLYIPEKVSKIAAWFYYLLLLALSILTAWQVGYYFSIICISINIILFLYAVLFKRLPLIGNLLVATCSAATVGVCVILADQQSFFIIFSFTCFAFFTSLIRELVKDIEDMDGDTAAGYHTYPIFSGVKGTKILVYAVTAIQVIMLGIFIIFAWGIGYKALAVGMAVTIAGFFYLLERVAKATEKGNYSYCSLLLKILMFLGITCLFLT